MAGHRITSRRGPWSKHYREFWQQQASNPYIPLPIRVFSLAYGCHGANGHTPFKPGELARALIAPPAADGRLKWYDRSTIYRAVETAKDYGYLDSRSSSRCLIVPQGQIQFAMGEYTQCAVCAGRVESR
jgi:hypothetical protein